MNVKARVTKRSLLSGIVTTTVVGPYDSDSMLAYLSGYLPGEAEILNIEIGFDWGGGVFETVSTGEIL